MRLNRYVDAYRLGQLSNIVGKGPVLILTHDNPDPDALASGKALSVFLQQEWNIPSYLAYSGFVGRAENRAMLQHLTPEWTHHENLPDLDQYSAIALVDTQPSAGNNRLIESEKPLIVFDHHQPMRDAPRHAGFSDVRVDFGSTVTLIYQYLDAVNIVPDKILATAMFYGLTADTLNMSRGVSEADKVAYMDLIGLVDRDRLVMIEQARRPVEYFQAYARGLQAARISGKAVTAWLGETHRPDMTADLADSLVRLIGVTSVMVIGQFAGMLNVALRTESYELDAGELIQKIVPPLGRAGGHGMIAGGQIYLEGRDPLGVVDTLVQNYLTIMGESTKSERLLDSI